MSRPVLYPLGTWCFWVLILPMGFILLGGVAIAMTDADEMPLDHPHLWWLVFLVPLAGLIILYGVTRRSRAIERFASRTLAPLLALRISPMRQAGRAGLLVTAFLLIVAAIIGPRWGMYAEKQTVHGVDIVIALDVSRSMLARDVDPNRLERAKREIRQQLTERAVFGGTNRLALIAFAGSTSVQVPLTSDHLTFRTKLEAIEVGSAPRGGTAIGEAIRTATGMFAKSPEEATKIILIFTDGEDHEGNPVEAATEAYEKHGVLVYTIGVGDPSRTVGAEVPESSAPGYHPLIYDGQIVFSKLDVDGLRKIAEAGKGRFAEVADVYQLVNSISRLKKTELTTEERQRHKPRYQWFLAIALFLLGLETTIRERSSRADGLPMRVWQQEAA